MVERNITKHYYCYFNNFLFNYPQVDIDATKILKTKEKDGYYIMNDVYEIPKWIAEIYYLNMQCFTTISPYMQIHEKVSINNISLFIDKIKKTSNCVLYFSVTDANYMMVNHIIDSVMIANKEERNIKIILGGYKKIDSRDNVLWFNSLKHYAKYLSSNEKIINYSGYTDYSLFAKSKCIPRLTLSKGCLNNCIFCRHIPKVIEEVSTEVIIQQAYSFKDLCFRYVYIDDKTFGQASNHKLLPAIYYIIKSYNYSFEGFIIQTTANQFLELKSSYVLDYIKIVEFGVEVWNENIRTNILKKPDTLKDITNAIELCIEHNIKVIPNILCGVTEDNATQILTEKWLFDNIDVLYWINVFYYNIGDNSECNNFSHISENTIEYRERLYNLQLNFIR